MSIYATRATIQSGVSSLTCRAGFYGFKVVRILLGLLLLAAVGLKLIGGSEGKAPLFTSPAIYAALLEAEILLGLWLLVGVGPRLLWLVTLLFFSGLAAASLRLGILGEGSCGCVGRALTLSPWLALLIDTAAVLALTIWRPPLLGIPNFRLVIFSGFRRLLPVAAVATIALGMLYAGTAAIFGSLDDAAARLAGESITIQPRSTELGDGVFGAERTFSVRLINRADRSIRVFGGQDLCNCKTTEDLPLDLGPREAREITVRIVFAQKEGRFQQSFFLYTDNDSERVLTGWFSGRAIGPND